MSYSGLMFVFVFVLFFVVCVFCVTETTFIEILESMIIIIYLKNHSVWYLDD